VPDAGANGGGGARGSHRRARCVCKKRLVFRIGSKRFRQPRRRRARRATGRGRRTRRVAGGAAEKKSRAGVDSKKNRD